MREATQSGHGHRRSRPDRAALTHGRNSSHPSDMHNLNSLPESARIFPGRLTRASSFLRARVGKTEQVPLKDRFSGHIEGVLGLPVKTTSKMATSQVSEPRTLAGRWVACGMLLAVAIVVIVVSSGGLLLSILGGLLLIASGALGGLTLGEIQRAKLEDQIDTRSSELGRALSELEVAQAETVRRLSMAVEFRDEDTGAHIERIGRFSTMLAELIGMEEDYCVRLSHAAPLHDVGKVAIPDAILLKPGPLTPDERAIVETHAEEGHRLLRGSSSSILDLASSIALSHHEKWDGTGYPRGLKGEAIPIEGRIVAIADVFDALTSDRVYRKAFSVDQAVEMMTLQRGRHFDPVLLDAFMEVLGDLGPDARPKSDDPTALIESVLDTYAKAIERGDAETAEGAIMQAIEDGVEPTILHSEVFAPAQRRIEGLAREGQMDLSSERHATGITRRIMATLYRYMLVGTEPNRERILLARTHEQGSALELQMIHDQLAAAGFQTTIDPSLSIEDLRSAIETKAPDFVVLEVSSSMDADVVKDAVSALRQGALEKIPIILWSVTQAADRLSHEVPGTLLLEQVSQSVSVVEGLIAREHAIS